jgi:hypothetical protein
MYDSGVGNSYGRDTLNTWHEAVQDGRHGESPDWRALWRHLLPPNNVALAGK